MMDHKKALALGAMLVFPPIILATSQSSLPVLNHSRAQQTAESIFDNGISNFKKARYYAAIKDFKHYDRLKPGEARTYELIGRSYALLGKTKEAERYFTLAERDPKRQASMMRFKRGLRLLGTISERDGDTPWAFSASLGGGYNSNVIALGNNFALPTDITRQASQFAEVLAFGHYRLMKDDESSLRILYQYLGDFYENLSEMNLQNPFVALEYRRMINPRTNFALNISSDNSWLGDNRFSSFSTVKPALYYQADRWNTFEFVYAYSNVNFFTPTTAVFNRDGFTNLLSINDYVSAPNSDLTVRFGYAANWSNTKGSDFAFQGNDFFLGFRKPFIRKFTVEGVYAYGSYRYDNLNSLANNFSYKRRDNTNRYTLQLLREINKTVTLYGRYDYFDDNANIPLYSYKQYIASLGLTANWS
jgi:hypothetical protein